MKLIRRNLLIFLTLLALVTVSVAGNLTRAGAGLLRGVAYAAADDEADVMPMTEAGGEGDTDKGSGDEGDGGKSDPDPSDPGQGGGDTGDGGGDDKDDPDDPDVPDGECSHYVYCDNLTVCARCGKTVRQGEARMRHVGEEHVSGHYEHDAKSHWWACGGCGEKLFVGTHYADCDKADSCEECGASGVTIGRLYHEFEDGKCIHCGVAESSGNSSSKKPSNRVSSAPASVTTAMGPDMYDDGEPRALVYAPNTGKATLRRSASANGQALTQLLDGTVVVVLNKEGRFTEVSVGGRTGYIVTSTLKMLDPKQRPIGEAMLTYPGTGGRGTTTINVRIEPSSRARKIAEWPTGTTVVVWSTSPKKQWYEVEYEGVRNYVQAQFVTMTTLYDYDMAAEEEASEPDDGE